TGALGGGRIESRELEQEMRSSFLDYAMSVIVSRALPDVRDGLKPVHRRVLYGMHEDGLQPNRPYKKSAATVGTVMSRYHPSSDSAIYDTLVRMAQPFSLRYPLVDGQGNFGSIDDDPAAAMRYTEARLSRIATELLRDIDANTVDFEPNYDESRRQPSVLPSRFPNLLVNGSTGIAVGMATNIPPHNLGEVVSGIVAMIDDPHIDVERLSRYIKGPDFPTGGSIVGRTGIKDAYRSGRGRITVRGRARGRRAAHAVAARADPALPRLPARHRHAPVEARATSGGEAGARPRGLSQGARQPRRCHYADPKRGGHRRCARRPDKSVRALGDPGAGDPRPSPCAPHRAGAQRDRAGVQGLAGTHRGTAENPRRSGADRRRYQGRT